MSIQNVVPIEILLIEDNPGDVDLTKFALKKAKMVNNVNVAIDGEDAMAFLRRKAKHGEAPRPDLVLLDINLPKKSGMEVLAEMKNDEGLRRIPVIMLTTSEAEADIIKAYDLHANSYVAKPVDLGQFMEAIRSLDDFWLAVVKYPQG
jgi:CheY-like chemotaxis protein